MGRKSQVLYYTEPEKKKMSGKEALLWCFFSLGIIWMGTSFMLEALGSSVPRSDLYFALETIHFFAGILAPVSAVILIFWVLCGGLVNYRKYKKPDIF